MLVRRSLIRLGDRKAPVLRCETEVEAGRRAAPRGGGGPGIDIIERGLLVSSKCHVDLPIASTAATATTAAIATATAAAAATTLPTVAALVKAKTREMMDGC